MSRLSPTDTIVAIATALGESGIGVIRLSGSSAVSILQALWQKPTLTWRTVPPQTAHVGLFGTTDCHDQVVALWFRGPASYTGEDVVEISAHGNPQLLQSLLTVCLQKGARLAEPGEFTERAFLNGKLDLTQAEAVADLIHAKTARARHAASAQLSGKLSEAVRALRERLLPLLAHVEVGLDHSDEDHDFLNQALLQERCTEVIRAIEQVLHSERVGKLLREGLQVAIIGRPNVGKSSLLNALLREDRAIVTAIPGTTRDTLEEPLDWDGIPVILIDTAGIRNNPTDEVEKIGIDRSRAAVEKADLVLCVIDGSQPLSSDDETLIQLASRRPSIVLINKSDLPSAIALRPEMIPLSAKTGAGLPVLVERVKALALPQQATEAEARWLLNARHRDALTRAEQALKRSLQAAQEQTYEECVALELRTALDALGEIIGETSTEDLLGQIFSQFCVGK